MSLEVSNLECRRGDRTLFSKLSFVLKNKQLIHLEGQNGTGKTTLLRALCGLFEADAGDILWHGKAIKKHEEAYRQELFYLGHNNAIKADLSALENLKISTALVGEKYSEASLMEALDEIGLFGFEYLPTRQLSQGQKRRVALAGLLLSKAKLWVLDEPFVALDADAVGLLQSCIAKHVDDGGMAIITTHQQVALTSGDVLRVSLTKEQASQQQQAQHV